VKSAGADNGVKTPIFIVSDVAWKPPYSNNTPTVAAEIAIRAAIIVATDFVNAFTATFFHRLLHRFPVFKYYYLYFLLTQIRHLPNIAD
jgi:hypothetical protein